MSSCSALFEKVWHKGMTIGYEFYGNHFVSVDDSLIVFSSEPDFSDNAFVLFEYMQKNGYAEKYHFVWLVSEPKKFSEEQKKYKNTVFVQYRDKNKRMCFKAMESLMKAKYFMGTHVRRSRVRKRNTGQTIINLWHGCGYKDTQHLAWNDAFDYCLVPGGVFVKTKSEFFGCSESHFLPIGYPRSDLLFSNNPKAAEAAENLKKDSNTKLIIWMPTFRKTGKNKYPEENIEYKFELPIFQSVDDMHRFDSFCRENNIIVLIKKHQYQVDFANKSKDFTNILMIGNDFFKEIGVQMYEFLPFTDALITDYSSAAIDYLLVDKPIGFTLDDYEQYKKTRGFVFENPLENMPGEHIFDYEGLESFVSDLKNGIDKYSDDRKRVKSATNNESCDFCKRVLEKLEI